MTSTIIGGRVVCCLTHVDTDPGTGSITSCRSRVLIDQPGHGAPRVEACVVHGGGNAAIHKADMMARRLRAGTLCQAFGQTVVLTHDRRAGEPVLRLTGVDYISGGETPHLHEVRDAAAA